MNFGIVLFFINNLHLAGKASQLPALFPHSGNREMNAGTLFSLFYPVQDPTPWNGAGHICEGLPT